jgi:enoyl-CoA hydratase/carnithine racemase
MGVTIEDQGAAAIVTLRWSEKRNALSADDARAVADAISRASAAEASAIVLTGDGAFCAGGDLRAFADLSSTLDPAEIRTHVYRDVQAMVRALRDAPLPTIAAVDGPAVGLGMDLALACDTRFVGPGGWLRQGWGSVGLISATGGTWFVEGAHRGLVWELLARQARLDGPRCEELGLARASSVPALTAAQELAEQLSAIPRDVLAAYAKLARARTFPDDAYLELCATLQSEFIGSERFRDLARRLLEGNG